MAAPTEAALIEAAARLARYAPTEWNHFVGAFSNYSAMHTSNLLKSAPEVLQLAQGRAQICAHLLGQLEDCVRLADKKGN